MDLSAATVPPAEQHFRYDRTVAPMVWALVGLAVLEMLALHLFLVLRWPLLAWPLLLLSASSIWWLVRWIRSFKRLPHRLAAGMLELNQGNLRGVSLPLDNIEAILTSWEDGGHKAAGTRSLVPIAHPNRMALLRVPEAKGRVPAQRIAFRVDECGNFDRALAAAGVTVRSGP